MGSIDRRSFLATSVAGAATLPGAGLSGAAMVSERSSRSMPSRPKNGPVAISSGNGTPAVTKAVEMMNRGADPLDAIVEGIAIVEADPEDMSVGYGGLPNEDGIVELDSSCMHGPTHKAGAVASLRNIMHPAQVAREVLRRTDHVLIVGEGALRFATRLGFEKTNLLTDRARQAWLRWKANLNPNDDWLDDDQIVGDESDERAQPAFPYTYGTIHCSAVDQNGDLAACTSTSGLSYKLPGRVGDSPLCGAGMFCDNEVGSAGATGRGESVIQSCGSFQIVQHMANGDHPRDACLKVLKWIADHTKRQALLNERGEPNFNVVFYAVGKDGEYASACMRGRRPFTVCDAGGARTEQCTPLFE